MTEAAAAGVKRRRQPGQHSWVTAGSSRLFRGGGVPALGAGRFITGVCERSSSSSKYIGAAPEAGHAQDVVALRGAVGRS